MKKFDEDAFVKDKYEEYLNGQKVEPIELYPECPDADDMLDVHDVHDIHHEHFTYGLLSPQLTR